MTTLKQKQLMYGTLIVLNVLFFVYWVMLSSNYSLHYDDVHFMWKMREYSIADYVKEMYLTRGGNFVGYGINGIVFIVSNWIGAYWFWPVLFYLLGVGMTFFAAKDILEDIPDWKLFVGVMAIYNVYILTVPDYAVFTWLCAMGYFLYAPAICLFLRYLNTKHMSLGKWCVYVFLALYLSGVSVALTPMVWLLMLVNALWLLRKAQWKMCIAWHHPIIRRIVYTTFGMLAIYVIMFFAPGNFTRLGTATDIQYPETVLQFGKAWGECCIMFVYFMAFYLPYHMLAVLLGYLSGIQSERKVERPWIYTLYVFLAMLVYLCVATIPLAYLSNGFGIQRNYTQITFFYILMWFIVGYICGNSCRKKETCVRTLTTSVAVFLCVIMGINLYYDTPLAIAYKNAHIERENYFSKLEEKQQTSEVCVTPFPSTATLDSKYVVLRCLGKQTTKQHIFYESDTDTIPNEYAYHIRKLYNLNFDIVIKKNTMYE